MRGVGRSAAAISIVNAIPAGIGSAVGIRLYVVVVAEIDPSAGAGGLEVDPPASSTPLVERSVHRALGAASPRRGLSVHLEVRSELPVARGLKSSSAVSTATIGAIFDALGHRSGPEEVARLAAEVGREAGVSATGAFDDALAGLVPGFVVTDNRTDRILLRAPVDPAWSAVVHLPEGRHAPTPALFMRFRAEADEGRRAGDSALGGRWAEAMERNSRLVERAMGYDYADVRSRLRLAGAWACGVSGVGPALVALASPGVLPAVTEAMPKERFVVALTSEAHP